MAQGVGLGMGVVNRPIGAHLWLEGLLGAAHLQPPLKEQLLQHRIRQQSQVIRVQLQSHVAVAQVIRRLQQGQGLVRPHHQKRFRRWLHLHQGQAILLGEPFPRLQGLPPRQLQQEISAAAAESMAPKASALLGGEG